MLVAVPDLRWSDLAVMPRLRAFALFAAAGELSVRGTRPVTRCADGIVTLSAGTRAAAADGTGCVMGPAQLDSARRQELHNRYAARIGALGDALHAAHLVTAAVGGAAVPLLADRRGQVDHVAADIGSATRDGDVVAVLDDALYRAAGGAPGHGATGHGATAARATAAQGLDALLARQLAAVPRNAVVVVAGLSDGPASAAHLHVLLVAGPGWRHRELVSASTGRRPFVQLIDVAPTTLAVLRLPVPRAMAGRPARTSGADVPTYTSFADDDRHAVAARAIGGDTMRGLAVATLVVLGLTVIAGWRRRIGVGARAAAALVVSVPVTTYLVQLTPWWRWGTGAYAGMLAAGAVAGALVVAIAARRGPHAALLGAAVPTAAVLVADQLAGSPLQLSAPLGDSPLVAGRFHGMGNVDFGIAAAALLLVAGALAGKHLQAGRRRAATALALAVVAVAVVVDAAPVLGDDFGGLLALVPAGALLAALVGGVRLSWRRVVGFVAAAAALAVAVAALDYARPAAHQTHIGRFVGDLMHGGGGRVLRRKLDAAAGSVGDSLVTWLVAVTAVVVLAARRALARTLRASPGLGPAAAAVAVLAVVGSVLNDSGIAVAAAVVVVAVPALVVTAVPALVVTAAPAPEVTAAPAPALDSGGPRGDPTGLPAGREHDRGRQDDQHDTGR